MTQTELENILKLHAKWLNKDPDGVWANLYGANLSQADLSNANLWRANLTGANLSGADLRNAILYAANLSRADLRGADLTGAYLYGANLTGADLTGADLTGANLICANLYGAYLSNADLSNADLSNANLSDANLIGANLSNADLTGANLYGAKPPDFQICPQNGSFIGYKKVLGSFILKLRVEGPRTNSLVGRKCRTSKAFVLEALNSSETEFKSMRDPNFIYKVGEYVEVKDYDPDIRIECTKGIHFFMTEKEAQAYWD